MKPINRRITRITSEEIDSELNRWDLPSVETPVSVSSSSDSGFMRKVSAVQPEPVYEEVAAERITVSELEAIKEQARNEAYENGYKEGAAKGLVDGLEEGQKKGLQQGYEEGFKSGKEAIEALQQNLAEMILQQEKPIEIIHDNLEKHLVDMVVDLARAVVGHTAALDSEVVTRAVDEMIEQIPLPHDSLKLHVHPDSVAVVEEMALNSRQSWQVVADPAIEKGGCYAQTLNTFADNTLPTRFAQVLRQFEQYRFHNPDSNDAAK